MPDTRKPLAVEAPPKAYQPSRKELREDLRIDATPEALAKAVTRTVRIVEKRPAGRQP